MNYFIGEEVIDDRANRTAGTKARDDIEKILISVGYKKVPINIVKKKNSIGNLIAEQRDIKRHWYEVIDNILENDSNLIIQFPLVNHTVYLKNIIKKIKSKGIKITFLVHDLDMFRVLSFKRKLRLFLEERNVFSMVDNIIVHNDIMKEKLVEKGIQANKLISLEIFDYLIDGDKFPQKIRYGTQLIVAGALVKHKVGYLYQGPTSPQYNLYGVGYEANFDNLKYKGSFEPEELPFNLEGSYGLIWDGDSLLTCSGTYGEYLRINNPHKTSLYLASGIPVVIWKGAALADFVTKNNVGISVDSLLDVNKELSKISRDEYEKMRSNAERIAVKLRRGYYTKKAISQIS